MARIPVERKRRGLPWWAWLLLALAIAALLWFLFELFNRDPNEAGDLNAEVPNAEVAPQTGVDTNAPAVTAAPATGADANAPAVDEPVTDMLIIVDAPDRASLVGKRVQFTDVTVQSVVGDKTFWIGPSKDKQLFVVLEENPSAGATEGQVDVNEGQTVTITGEIRQLPSMEEARSQWGLSEANSAELEQQQVYLQAQQVQITGQ